MSEWIDEQLGNVLEVKYGKDHKSLKDGKIPCFGSGGLMRNVEKYLYDKPSILIPRKGSLNNIMYQDSPFWTVDTMFWSKIDEDVVLPKFLFYQLTLIDYILLNVGSAVPSLTVPVINEIDIKLPPLPEQKAIASVLSSLDDKIDLLHRQNKTLEAMAETLFRQWFVVEADDSWEEKELNDVLKFVVDNRGRTAPTSDSGIPLIATNCIKNNNIYPVYEKVRYVDQQTYEEWFRAHPDPGDIIFVNKGTPGCVNFVPDPVDFCIAQDMVALRVNYNVLSKYYLFLLFRSYEMQSDIVNSSVGTTIPHLKKTDLLKFMIIVPSKDILDEFDNIVSEFFLKMNTNIKQVRTLEKLRDTLLPKLMSGEVRCTEPGEVRVEC